MDRAFQLTYLNHALLSYISAFGAHRVEQRAAAEEVLPLAEETLAVLLHAAEASGGLAEKRPVPELLAEIRAKAHATAQSVPRQQLTLLYNIADATGQVLNLSGSLSKAGN